MLNVGVIKRILSTMTDMSDRIEKLEEEFVKQDAAMSSLKTFLGNPRKSECGGLGHQLHPHRPRRQRLLSLQEQCRD